MKKKIAVFIGLAILAMCVPLCGCEKQSDGERIYERCIDNVVEVKAVTEGVGESFGTAEIISEDGKLVTNAHVVTYTKLNTVNTFEEYFVRFSDEEEYRPVMLERYDTEKDLALLSFADVYASTCDIYPFKPVKFGNSDDLKAGEEVYAVGNASNYGIGIFKGIVSIPLINVVLDGVTRSVIQSDITIAAGNSGGALMNARGELAGITTFRTKDNSGNVIYGIVYSIPVKVVLEFVNQSAE